MKEGREIAAVILAGGLGMRLRSVVPDRPKALAPVGDWPFITFLLDQLAAASFRRAMLLVGYRAAQVRQSLGTSYGELSLSYGIEASPLGTAGAVREALPRIEAQTLLVMNGDSFCDVDLGQFIAHHRGRRADLSFVVADVPDVGRFGRVDLAGDGRVTGFAEKRGGGPGRVNAGIYLVERSLAAEIPYRQPVSLERDMLPLWLGSRRIYGFPGCGRFLDIGTPADYAAAEDLLELEARSCPLS